MEQKIGNKKLMIYALLHAPGDLRIEEKPIPEIESDKVMVKVEACGICGTDILIYDGKFPVELPYSPGHEYSGTVTAVGDKVKNIKAGDRVVVDPNHNCGYCHYCIRGKPHLCENLKEKVKSNGGFADYCMVPRKIVHKIPDSLSFEEAALVETLSCALHGVQQARINPGDLVTILGGGAMGLMILQLVRNSGAGRIILSEPVEKKRMLAKELGADTVVNPQKEDIISKVFEKSFYGADIVIENVGLPQTVKDALRIVKRGGTVIFSGICGKEVEIPISPFQITKNELTVRGAFLNPYTFSQSIELISSGRIKAFPLITHKFPLEKIDEAMNTARGGEAVKVIVIS